MTHCDDAMAERIAEFKNDPQKMQVADTFVSEVIERAKDEASKRMREKKVSCHFPNDESVSERRANRLCKQPRSLNGVYSKFAFTTRTRSKPGI